MSQKYNVRLTEEERKELVALVTKGKGIAYRIKHAHILLKADVDGPNWSDEAIAEAFAVHVNTPRNIRQRFVDQGLQAALGRKPRIRPGRQQVLDGNGEAHLIAMTRSQPPEGYNHWSLRLLADKLVELEIVETISYETVRRTLKKTNSNRTCQSVG